MPFFLGLDFGTESVRALIVDSRGREHGVAISKYRHGVIDRNLPGYDTPLPPRHAHQHPLDWIDSAARATRAAIRNAGAEPRHIAGIGSDFTSCTMLPVKADGTPLCLLRESSSEPQAWPKLWKHHAAQAQTDRLNRIARERREPFLKRYGGIIGLEWLLPKILETLELAPRIHHAADLWIEAGDWFVWQLTGTLARSTCQAGYKGLWSAADGYPGDDFLRAIHPGLANLAAGKLSGPLIPPGHPAGALTPAMAKKFGLPAGVAVSASIIDAHAGVPGSGAAGSGTLVMVMGTSSCHMLNSPEERDIPGIAGVVKDGILPGFHGYETGQAAVGDAFDWLRRLAGRRDFTALDEEAAALPPGADGVRCLDWLNGCRTPLMDGSLHGAFTGLSLHHGPAHLYRALMEASACGLRWIVELLRDGGLAVNRFIATGGLPHHNPLLVQIYADILGQPIVVPPTKQGPALGSAILGALAAGAFPSASTAIAAMALQKRAATIFKPTPKSRRSSDNLYTDYRRLAQNLRSSI